MQRRPKKLVSAEILVCLSTLAYTFFFVFSHLFTGAVGARNRDVKYGLRLYGKRPRETDGMIKR